MSKFRLSPEQSAWFYDFMLVKVEKTYPVVETKEIDYGCQLILKSGTVVNLYHSLKYSLGGRPDTHVKSLVIRLIENFRTVMEIEKETEYQLQKYMNA